jgi:phosphinothricin acetyltransferase
MDYIIRKAEKKDLPQLLQIYNYEVENGVATLDIHPRTTAQWEEWFYAHNVGNHPLYVAAEGENVLGYVSLSPYREKEAFASTVELSIYIGAGHRNKGIASALMEFIIEAARKDKSIHNVVSVITAGNEASTRLHNKFGFEFCGTIPQVGVKNGAYQDIENYSLIVS